MREHHASIITELLEQWYDPWVYINNIVFKRARMQAAYKRATIIKPEKPKNSLTIFHILLSDDSGGGDIQAQ